jgi:L-aspartate oxidase
MAYSQAYDVAIIGSGIAGLSVALRLPESLHIALFTKGQLGESNTRYAQGGLAAALGPDDSPELHFQDTIAAGAGHCDEQAVRILVEHAPSAVAWLIAMGVQFDQAHPNSDAHTTRDGLLLGREAAHSRWRVLHAGGDATGAEIERALVNALRKRPSITLYEETFVSDLLVSDGVCCAVEAIDRHGNSFTVRTRSTVLANGGAGGLWLHTSNPSGATADGLALAWRAGAALTDLEFMQFHPTVLVMDDGSHLISEAVRGEGAYLRNHAGERFMPKYHPQAELAPRDVVARAILSEMLAEQTSCQFLDLRHLPAESMHARFPSVSSICHSYGLDLAKDLLPIAPAAHYFMGGVMTDTQSRTTLPGLYAVGEVACTGVHGANRLASNSLLEGLVFGLRLADTLKSSCRLAWHPQGPQASTQPPRATTFQETTPTLCDHPVSASTSSLNILQQLRHELRQIMWCYVSLTRNERGLLVAKNKLNDLRHIMTSIMPVGVGDKGMWGGDPCGRPWSGSMPILNYLEMSNMLQVAGLVVAAALQRRESRGSHWRSDYDAPDEKLATCKYVFQRAIPDLDGSKLDLSIEEMISHV